MFRDGAYSISMRGFPGLGFPGLGIPDLGFPGLQRRTPGGVVQGKSREHESRDSGGQRRRAGRGVARGLGWCRLVWAWAVAVKDSKPLRAVDSGGLVDPPDSSRTSQGGPRGLWRRRARRPPSGVMETDSSTRID